MRRLILRPGAIGDCILSLPALEHLVTEFTEVWIPSPVIPLIKFADRVRSLSSTGIDLIGIADREIPWALRTELQSFDSVVSWYGANRPEFRNALRRLGIHCEFLPALPPERYYGHATSFYAEQVGANPKVIPMIAVAPSSSRSSAVIHPFSGSSRKNWPLSSFEALANCIKPLKAEWIVGPEERLDNAIHFDNLADLASWLTGARLYVGNDSGITHLAAAAGVLTLAIFGPTDPAKWAPRGNNVSILRSEPLQELSVEVVLAAVNQLLG